MSHHDDCETCGRQDETMYSCQDTIFCADCWKDFGTDRWKGIGSKKPKAASPMPSQEPVYIRDPSGSGMVADVMASTPVKAADSSRVEPTYTADDINRAYRGAIETCAMICRNHAAALDTAGNYYGSVAANQCASLFTSAATKEKP